ncbi:MAG: DUF3667 domain-containing protein [Novosphingobium sp.]
MTGGGEIIGDIAQGALIARAVEPAHGESPADDGHSHERACLNCGAMLVGSHCHACGQAAHVHRTLGAFFHDLLHGVFHFEGKIWRTLPLLAWKPGLLTREYIDGKRASYVSPIALFLFVVFLTFAVFNLLGSPIDFGEAGPGQISKGVSGAAAEARANVVEAEMDLAEARAGGAPTARLEQELKQSKMAVETIAAAQGGKLPEAIAASNDPTDAEWVRSVNRTWAKARENPELVVYKLQQSAYKFSWLLIPLSVPFVWLLFPFSRRFHLYDHTVFVTYSLSFMLLLFAAMSVAAVWAGGWLLAALFFYAPFHMYRQLKGTYGLTRLGAWWRTWFLSAFAFVALVLFATALTAMVAAE